MHIRKNHSTGLPSLPSLPFFALSAYRVPFKRAYLRYNFYHFRPVANPRENPRKWGAREPTIAAPAAKRDVTAYAPGMRPPDQGVGCPPDPFYRFAVNWPIRRFHPQLARRSIDLLSNCIVWRLSAWNID